MRSRRSVIAETRTKPIVLTGGLKEDISQIELKAGELIECVNYQEIDGIYHGYASIPGYEVFDGTALASSVLVTTLNDYGLDNNTSLLLEADLYEDKSINSHTVVNTGVVPDSTIFKFLGQSYQFNGIANLTVSPSNNSLDIGSGQFALDALYRPTPVVEGSVILEKSLSYKLYVTGGRIAFAVSTDGLTYTDEIQSDITVVANRRYHIEITRYTDDTIRMFIDGDLQTSDMVVSTFDDNSENVVVGSGFIGTMEEIRVSKGVARHIYSFDIPTLIYSHSEFKDLQVDDVLRESRRSQITPVPGEGQVLGVKIYDADVYAARDDVGVAAASLYKSSAGGWVQMTGSRNPGGSYRWSIGRYPELVGHQREEVLFFTSGTDYPAYLDGTSVVDITSVYLPDDAGSGFYANNLIEFKSRLFLAYPDGRLVFSAVDDPLNFEPISGAGEIYMEDEIMDMVVAPGDALLVFCRRSTFIIKALEDVPGSSGTVTAAYKFYKQTFSKQSGAMHCTAQRILGTAVSMSERGITTLEATNVYGDFSNSYISKNVQKLLIDNRENITCTVVHRMNNQYRMYFNDGMGLIFTFDAEKAVKGVGRTMYNTPVISVDEGLDASGNIMLVFGSTDGFVYMMDSGTSFNGADIQTKMSTAYHSYNSPSTWKRFRKISLEINAEKDLTIYGLLSFDYGSPNIPRVSQESFDSEGSGGIWGTDRWGLFTYGATAVQNPTMYASGFGKNMSITLSTIDRYRGPHILNAVIVEYVYAGRVM